MGSPITLSGFNNIDFSVVVNAIMAQASQPLQTLQFHESDLQAMKSAYSTLASKLSALQSSSSALSDPKQVMGHAVSSSDATSLSATASSSAVSGQYDVVISQLAHAQVTVSNTTAPDADTTVIATGGSLTIGGVAVNLAGPATLSELASQINGTSGIGVTASIVETDPGAFRLVLTGTNTGAAHAFTIQNALTGGSGLSFTDTDNNGTSGDSAADNAAQAINAAVTINNVAISSASNTLTSGIPGVTVNLLQKDPSKAILVTVGGDNSSLISRMNDFVSAYNDLADFAAGQATAAGQGNTGTLGHDAMLRSVRNELRTALTSAYGAGSITQLAEIGIGFEQNGHISLDATMLGDAIQSDPAAVAAVVSGDGTNGAFAAVNTLLTQYTRAGGFVPSAQTGITQAVSRLDNQIADMQARLAIQRTSLQQQFTAADQAIARLNSQTNALSSITGSFSNASINL